MRPDGSIRTVAQEGEVHFDAAGVPLDMLGTVQDVTDRRAAEQHVADMEERFRTAFQTSADAISISRLDDGLYVDVNDAFVQIYGYAREDIVGRTSEEVGIWCDPQQRVDAAERIARERIVRNLVLRHRHKDGQPLTVLASASVCMIADEPHILASIKDITDLQRVEAELRKLWHAVDQSSAAVLITNNAGRIEYVNPCFSDITGYQRDEVVGKPSSILKSGRTADGDYRRLWQTIQSGENWQGEIRNRRKDGSFYWGDVSISPVKASDGTITHFIGIEVDITQRKQAEEELRASEERFRSLIETSLFGICIDQDGRPLFVNQTFAQIFGYESAAEIVALGELMPLYPPSELARAEQYRQVQLRGGRGPSQYEIRGVRKDGSIIWLHTQSRLVPWNGATAVQSTVVDITLRKRYEDRLVYQANYDPVTELPNRTLALDRLSSAIVSGRRRACRVAVLFIDVDHFKKINDTLGHATGDRFLRQVAQRVKGSLREEDTVARLGGDEFIVVLPDVRLRSDVEAVAAKITAAVAQPFMLEGQETFVTVSVGAALFPDDGDEADGLMRHADAAMYVAKDEGRGTVRFFTPHLGERNHNRIRLEAELRHALEREQLSVCYQPLVDIRSGRIVGAEALLRWFSPVYGQISPDQFIPLAEDTGLIMPIGEWVLQTGCRDARAWHDAGFDGVGLSVNVSSRQFRGESLVEAVCEAIAANRLQAHQLELEITESLLLEDLEEIKSTIARLEGCGVRFAVDDFGTGYSSLSYLNRFPIDTLKIDRSFVKGLLTDTGQATLVDALILMAHRLHLRVIAEGVETRDQLEFLRARACDVAQGFYFSPPVSPEKFLALLHRWNSGPEACAV
jgi:diguanylate cyclase (GGDEF)-like protein/PAS domain S-box-containing protein